MLHKKLQKKWKCALESVRFNVIEQNLLSSTPIFTAKISDFIFFINFLPNYKTLDWYKFKAFADYKINVM